MSGVDFKLGDYFKESFGLTSPLITLASGAIKWVKQKKVLFGLNRDLYFTPYEYWQFWRNTDDRDVEKFLNFLPKWSRRNRKSLQKEEEYEIKLKIILANEAKNSSW